MITRTLLVTGIAAILTGCGAGIETTDVGDVDNLSMSSSTPAVGAALPTTGTTSMASGSAQVATSAMPSAVSGSVALQQPTQIDVDPYVDNIETNGDQIVPVPVSESSTISAEPTFLFDTSRTVRLKVGLADVVGIKGSLSICTDYEETATGFDINYNSCPIRATVENGQLEKDMSLMNQFDSVVAVIWFRDREIAPKYMKFDTADLVAGTESLEWNWN